EDLARRAVGIGGADLRYLALAHHDFERLGIGFEEHGSVLRGDVGDQVAESVYLQYYPSQSAALNLLRFWRGEANDVRNLFSHLAGIDPLRQVCGNGSENVARVKRVADGLQEVVVRHDMANRNALLAVVDQ